MRKIFLQFHSRNNDESIRIYRGTVSLLRCFMFFDVCWLLSGIALIVMALTSNVYPSKEKVKLPDRVKHKLYIDES